jgi:di/tricarboxylate transporter
MSRIALALVAIIAPLLLLATTRVPPVIALCGAAAFLYFSGVLTIGEVSRGFVDPAVLTIAALYIVVAGIKESGAIEWLARPLIRRPRGLTGTNARLIGAATALSTLMNNTPIVAMFIPIAQEWARRSRLPIAQILLPLNNAVILGGLCSLIGTSTNLAVNGLYAHATGTNGLRFFEIAWVGVPLALLGVAYALIAAPRLLGRAQQRRTSSALDDAAPVVEAAVATRTAAPALLCVGSSAAESTAFVPEPGHHSAVAQPAENASVRGFAPASVATRAPLALAILGLVAANGVLSVVSLLEGVTLGAAAMIVTRCVSLRRAFAGVDYPTIVSIGASFALGAALTGSGAAATFGAWLSAFTYGDPLLALIVLYVATVAVTEAVTNNAAGVVMFPLAMSVAASTGADPKPFVIAIMVGASAGFLTPIGYQTNLMVYRPGGYRIADFIRYGLPLSIFTGVVALTLIPRIWPL